jgi:hypothetical protein
MTYTALPDRRIPYDNDGTIVGYGNNGLTEGLQYYLSGSQTINMQDTIYDLVVGVVNDFVGWWFFPEQRELTAYFIGMYSTEGPSDNPGNSGHVWYGSNNSGNGLDGTWETASLPGGTTARTNVYSWRDGIKPISFTGPKKVVRFRTAGHSWFGRQVGYGIAHLYGEKAAGQTPDDIIFIDHDTTPGVEYTAPEDFGDQPLGTTVVRQFRVKNASASKTANTINIQCNDSDFAISTDGSTWVVTINITSLAAGTESSTMYIRSTTPAPGNLLGPRFARIVVTVASYT